MANCSEKQEVCSPVSLKLLLKTGGESRTIYWVVPLAIILFIHLVLSFILFDPSINLMADDANYIMEARRFLEEGRFPLAHGATLYHFVIALAYTLFGKSLIVGKFCSMLFSAITLMLSYFAFRRIVNQWMLFGILFIQSSNYLIHFYGSSNMSESFFMMVQMIFILVVLNRHDSLVATLHNNKNAFLHFLSICIPVVLISFLFSISKTIAIIAPISVIVYLVFKRKWLNGAIFASLFLLFKFAYSTAVKTMYGIDQLSNRLDYVLLKNSFHPDQGNETMLGLIGRMWENFKHHISSDMLRILGWRENFNLIEPITAFSLLFLLLFALVLWGNWQRSSKMFFVGLYLILLASATFVSLQTHWKQDRMILIMIPLMLIFLLDGAYTYLVKRNSAKIPLLYAALAILGLVNLNHLSEAIARSRAIQREYFRGNDLFAYTPDWQNYLKAVQWAGEYLPENSVVLCRKPNTAYVYSTGNISFQGRSLNTSSSGDSVLRELQEQGVTHILLANLRINPNQAIPGMVIGAIHSYVRAILEWQPAAIRALYTSGSAEPAYILELDYAPLNAKNRETHEELSMCGNQPGFERIYPVPRFQLIEDKVVLARN